MKTLSSLSDYKSTNFIALNFPSQNRFAYDTPMDNIVLTGGSDRNLRFLNFGNGYGSVSEELSSMDKEFGDMNCFHLSNVDNNPRYYKYIYSGDCLMLKEELANTSDKFKQIKDPIAPFSNFRNGLSYYHNSFLYQKKSTHILPGHTAAIRDIMVLENDNDILVATAGDDNTIKIWN
jgi:WD40 repeat protein